MRRKLAPAIVILGLLGSSLAFMAPANAILGLSQCEKVHKEVKAIEKKFFSDYKGIRTNLVQGYQSVTPALTSSSVVLIATIRTNDPIPKIWKIGFNNPKCFSNTQILQIKTMKNKTISNYFDYMPEIIYSPSAKCVKLYKNGKKYDQSTSELCITSRVQKWMPIAEYKSIYSY
jgi:hypothetical protein